ncbi:transcriptional regulator [Paraclostridium tenue]|uniref:HTH cro/C1-type domain-containing protein n=1 Tax=Paraclostridium tenue TaxID=1737 RepID=A0ABN1LY41_9FIRM
MKLTPFGKFTRKLRVDNEELLKDMANNLNVTVSYLSAVEIGKRNIPKKWESILADKYNLNLAQKQELEDSIFSSSKIIKLDTSDLEENKKDLVYALARKLKDLDEEDVSNIKNILCL